MAKKQPISPSSEQLAALCPEVAALVETSGELKKLIAGLDISECRSLTAEVAQLYSPGADAPGVEDIMSRKRVKGSAAARAIAGADRISRLSGTERSQDYLEQTKRR